MATAAEEMTEALITRGQLSAAASSVARWNAENARDEPSFRRLGAAVYALSGSDRELGGIVEPPLLACRTQAEGAAYLALLGAGVRSHDYAVLAVVLTWAGDANGAYLCLREAHDRALSEKRFHVAVAARERLAHHALLFGDVAVARTALDEAVSLAAIHRLANWRLRCAAAAARLALEAGDLDRAGKLVDEGRAAPPDLFALFAPTGARLAIAAESAAALRVWTSAQVVETALRSHVAQSAAAATVACVLGAGATPPLDAPIAVALRRALLQTQPATNDVALFSLAARCGEPEEARLAVDALRAVFAPRRLFLEAHYLLARAHLLFRSGDRAEAIDSAGDAARAFDAMGLRLWTNEAMLLLVHHDGVAEAPRRRRPTALSLTGREQQVAHLIRRGASNREVAHTLQISEHTVERHVSSILSRMGLRSRWQIVDARNVVTEH